LSDEDKIEAFLHIVKACHDHLRSCAWFAASVGVLARDCLETALQPPVRGERSLSVFAFELSVDLLGIVLEERVVDAVLTSLGSPSVEEPREEGEESDHLPPLEDAPPALPELPETDSDVEWHAESEPIAAAIVAASAEAEGEQDDSDLWTMSN
jgi:hypothetical protein